MNTIQLTIQVEPSEPWKEIFTANLADFGFDAFEEKSAALIAYGPENQIKKEEVEILLNEYKDKVESLSFEFETLAYKNWNEEWEKDFEPVFVEDKLSILAPFHDEKLRKKIAIEIQPQMSFGTGHHQTTWMMSKALLDLPLLPESVLDMGTGTGVLAILAEKLGAQKIIAIDNEPWSVENAIENVKRNNCSKISCFCGSKELISSQNYDLILANINKNVLKDQMQDYIYTLKENGKLFISGFFDSDTNELITFVEDLGLKFDFKNTKETWALLAFIKK